MEKFHLNLLSISVFLVAIDAYSSKPIYSSRLIHRFSDEAQNLWASKNSKTTSWPERSSFVHTRMLLGSDLKRQRLKLGNKNQILVDSRGSGTYDYGNELGWLHYTWIDLGTPNTSFLVALDSGSDLSWVPCECVQCAPLSLSYYSSLDTELNEYNPSHSSTSKHIPCSHELCEMGNNCNTQNGHCPYTVDYLSQGTESSGYLFQDQLHLASVGGNKPQSKVQATVMIGCGSKQSGSYLDGIAPDGLMGLGPGSISIPSMLAKSGLIPHSFSFCFDDSYSGRLFFGDQGTESQRSTSFLSPKDNFMAYIVNVEHYCVGDSCLSQTGFKAQVDTGSSFTYLPSETYKGVVLEFNRQAKAKRISTQGFDYCYKASSVKLSDIPVMKLVFSPNQSFVIENPVFRVADDQGDLYCLGVHSIDGDNIGIIGQNFLMGYRTVFDWENMKFGWSISNCQDIGNGSEVDLTPPSNDAPPNPLPTNNQQQKPLGGGNALAPPAEAGRAPKKNSDTSTHRDINHSCIIMSLILLWSAYQNYLI